jgi:hypothetical protein
MRIVKVDLLDGQGLIDVVVVDLAAEQRLRRFANDADGAFADQERWIEIERRMRHQRCGDSSGWTLEELLPGDSPTDAVDDARIQKGTR